MAATHRRYSKTEIAERGDAIYATTIRARLTPHDDGKFVAIDVDSGTYEMSEDERTAGDRVRTRFPDAQIWTVRLGSRAVHRFRATALTRDLRAVGSRI